MDKRHQADKLGNNQYNGRIMDLVMSGFTPWRIYKHLMIEEKAVYDAEPISYTTIYRRAKLYEVHREEIQQFYDQGMTLAEREAFMIRMKLLKKG